MDYVTVCLSVDEVIKSPRLQISGGSSPLSSDGTGELSPDETNQAINFILALEHVCWNHYSHSRDPSANENGHMLTATALCLQSAPQAAFTQIDRTTKRLRSKFWPVSLAVSGDVSWQSSGATLQSLHGLASSLNPGDKELTPAQAWFELAVQYHPAILLKPRVVESLKREFVGVVKCVRYGAVIERGAFDSIVGRIVKPELLAPNKTRDRMDK